ncbi:V8-like Glu-specific endopeptidase [Kineococcus xinjiangensis]|uniref:V8-like Glu-specific endopeptidase n=1 Tax=Kineococcus xinjiangensis TaxID=512762 RepID=A0A2S6IVX5_9ACTN|nr:trypsin-like peptidase domain-containing protein [Kineococcus xinjiangensis]PPK98504.1 V8-like Glu-specific endopeptidase [Kineococcus xinjiangensis]
MPAPTRTPLAALAAGLLSSATALVLTAAPASAEQVGADRGAAGALLSAAGTAAEQQRATDHWTPERMRAAVPADVARPAVRGVRAPAGAAPSVARLAPGRRTAAVAASDELARGQRVAAPTAEPVGVRWSQGGAVATATGRIFFVRDGESYVCSGSSVASANRSTVVTAGHCLTEQRADRTPADSTEVVFVPGYADGEQPHGVWPVTVLAPAPQWRDGAQGTTEAANHDVGFAVVAPRADGKRLADVVGALPIAFDTPPGQRVAVFGYPAAPPFDGARLQHCRGMRFANTVPGSTVEGVNCFMTGGSSGGPWLSRFDGRTGTVTSVVSFSYEGADQVMYGPRFDDSVRALHASAGR